MLLLRILLDVPIVLGHMVMGYSIHRWLDARGLRLPTDAGAWAGLLFAVYALYG